MVEVKKKDNESNEGLIRRFVRKIQGSGNLIRVKQNKFHQKKKNKRQTRLDAIRREKVKNQYDYLRKIGKIDENERRFGRGRKSSRIKIKIK